MNFIDSYHKLLTMKDYPLPSGYEADINEEVELLSTIAGRYLAEQHGDVLDFSYLLRPYYYFFLFIYANGSFIKPVNSDADVELQPLLNINKISELSVDGWVHRMIYAFSTVDDPVQFAMKLLGQLPSYEGAANIEVIGNDSVHENNENTVGISLSIVTFEKLILWVLSKGKLRFVRPHKYRHDRVLAINPVIRRDILEKLLSDPDARQLDDNEYRLLLSSVLLLPTYFIENFKDDLMHARKLVRGISSLICGIEFQHKPQIAISLALLKQRGKRLIGSQHGGAYGQTRFSSMERVKRFLFGEYITWGFQFYSSDHPLPSIRLSRPRITNIWHKFGRRRPISERNTILVLLPYMTPSLIYSAHAPNVLQQHEALLHSLEILESVAHLNFKIILRMHPRNVAQDYEPAIPDFLQERVTLVHGKRGSFWRDMHKYEYVMFTSPNATGLSECIVNDVRFNIIARTDFYKIRPEAEHIYQTLRDADVWVTEPEQLIRVLKAGNINDRQKAALDLFGKMYAFHTYAYLGHWSRFINRLKSGRS